MGQDGDRLRRRTRLSPGLPPRALLQVAVPLAASVLAHAAVVAAIPGRRGAAPVVPAPPPAEWVEATEPVTIEPVAPAAAEEGEAVPPPTAVETREPAAHPTSASPSDVVNLPPPDAIPGAHAGTPVPLVGKARADWWAAARKVPVGPLDGRDGYDAIRAQIAGWNPRLVTGTYVPGGSRIAHPDEMPSQRLPGAVITSVIQSNGSRFRVCHGAGLPQSATISGQVIVTFVIEPDGHVSEPRDAGGTFPDDAVRRCVVRAVAQLAFPKPPAGVAQPVTIPVVLQADEAVARPDLHGTSEAPP